MNSALIKRLRKIATLESEDYGAEPQDHSSWQAADLIERQAAQIEVMREGFTNIMVNTCEKFPGQRILQIMEICNKSLSSAPDQALEQFAAIADLSGVIMCEKKPVAYMAVYKDQVMGFIPTQESGTIPVYRAIKELP